MLDKILLKSPSRKVQIFLSYFAAFNLVVVLMPFTFAHPAIVLPLRRLISSWFSLTGLVMGSVIPDFEYFIRMDDKKVYTHTWTGLFLYDLPLGIFLAFAFHNIVRNSFINHTPQGLQQRLLRYKEFNWNAWFRKKWFSIIISFLLGGATHFIWDSFTHKNRFFVRHITFLHTTFRYKGVYIHPYIVLELLSSFIGMIIIIYAIWQLPVDKRAKINRNIIGYWIIAGSITVTIFAIRMFFETDFDLEDIIIPAISAFLIALVITPVFLKLKLSFKTS